MAAVARAGAEGLTGSPSVRGEGRHGPAASSVTSISCVQDETDLPVNQGWWQWLGACRSFFLKAFALSSSFSPPSHQDPPQLSLHVGVEWTLEELP